MITDLKKTLVKWNAPVESNNFYVIDVLHSNKAITEESNEILGQKKLGMTGTLTNQSLKKAMKS